MTRTGYVRLRIDVSLFEQLLTGQLVPEKDSMLPRDTRLHLVQRRADQRTVEILASSKEWRSPKHEAPLLKMVLSSERVESRPESEGPAHHGAALGPRRSHAKEAARVEAKPDQESPGRGVTARHSPPSARANERSEESVRVESGPASGAPGLETPPSARTGSVREERRALLKQKIREVRSKPAFVHKSWCAETPMPEPRAAAIEYTGPAKVRHLERGESAIEADYHSHLVVGARWMRGLQKVEILRVLQKPSRHGLRPTTFVSFRERSHGKRVRTLNATMFMRDARPISEAVT